MKLLDRSTALIKPVYIFVSHLNLSPTLTAKITKSVDNTFEFIFLRDTLNSY